MADDHFQARTNFQRIGQGKYELPQVALAIHMDGEPAGFFSPPACLGEHSETMLRSLLGYDDRAIAGLPARGVI